MFDIFRLRKRGLNVDSGLRAASDFSLRAPLVGRAPRNDGEGVQGAVPPAPRVVYNTQPIVYTTLVACA